MTDPRLPQGGNPPQQPMPPDPRGYQTQCPSCGIANDVGARFCRNCGLPLGAPQDPVRGTSTRRADLPSEHGTGLTSIIGLVAALVLLATAVFLVLRAGDTGATPRFTPTPGPSSSDLVFPSGASPFASAETPLPAASASVPAASSQPSAQPTATPIASGGSFTPSTGFTCDLATLTDPTNGKWYVSHLNWARRSTYDQVILTLTRNGSAATGALLTIQTMTPANVTGQYGVSPPSDGQQAVVLNFDSNAKTNKTLSVVPGYAAVRTVDVVMDTNSQLDVVIGVNGSGCHRLSAPKWLTSPTSPTVDILIDIQR